MVKNVQRHLQKLPAHLARMALFDLQEISLLHWFGPNQKCEAIEAGVEAATDDFKHLASVDSRDKAILRAASYAGQEGAASFDYPLGAQQNGRRQRKLERWVWCCPAGAGIENSDSR
jgi:hypothetical protein